MSVTGGGDFSNALGISAPSGNGDTTPATGATAPSPIPNNATTAPVVNPSTGTTSDTASSGTLTRSDVMNYWMQAGGNPRAAAMAAAIADAESGYNSAATRTNPDGTTSTGLWLTPTNGTPPGSTDPLASAKAAIQLSNNGTDWTQWCVAWSDNNCGTQGGTYLGQGSNALMALGSEGNSTYQVIGSTPAGSGASASSTTSSSSVTGTSGPSHTILLIGLAIVVILAIVYFTRRTASKPPEEPEGPIA